MGMDAIRQLEGVRINGDGVDFGAAKCAVAVHSSKDCEVGKEKRGNGHRGSGFPSRDQWKSLDCRMVLERKPTRVEKQNGML